MSDSTNIKKINNNRDIIVYDVTFQGFSDLKKYALSGNSKDGIYVGEDSKSYPCFDSSDYAFENRRYWNFVFARNKKELEDKLYLLKRFKTNVNYNKLNCGIYPIVYFGGDNNMLIEVKECDDIVIPNMIQQLIHRQKGKLVKVRKK